MQTAAGQCFGKQAEELLNGMRSRAMSIDFGARLILV